MRSGILPKLDALSLNRVEAPQPLTPFPYREARTEELPRVLLQYISCPADPHTYRYALLIRRAASRSGGELRQAVDFGEPIYVIVRFDKWERRFAALSVKTGFRNDDAPFRKLRLRRSMRSLSRRS